MVLTGSPESAVLGVGGFAGLGEYAGNTCWVGYLSEVGYLGVQHPSVLPLFHGTFCVFWGVLCGFSIVGRVCFFWHFSLVFFGDGIYSFLHSVAAFVGDM